MNFTPQYRFTLFCCEAIFIANLRTFWRTFYRFKKYGGVPNMTNMAYAPLQAADKLCGEQTTAGYLQIPGRRSNHLI